jgi:hypothetical protein
MKNDAILNYIVIINLNYKQIQSFKIICFIVLPSVFSQELCAYVLKGSDK